jgi:hypothetical protein
VKETIMADATTAQQAQDTEASLTKVAAMATETMPGLGYVIVALHPDGYAQYTTNLEPSAAASLMVDLGNGMLHRGRQETLLGG